MNRSCPVVSYCLLPAACCLLPSYFPSVSVIELAVERGGLFAELAEARGIERLRRTRQGLERGDATQRRADAIFGQHAGARRLQERVIAAPDQFRARADE